MCAPAGRADRLEAVTQTQPVAGSPTGATATEDQATKTFSTSVLISAIRCTLTYVVFPWIFPLIGLAGGIGPGIGVVVGLIAIVSNIFSIRRFWTSDHRWKWYVMPLNAGIIVLLSILLVIDIGDLL